MKKFILFIVFIFIAAMTLGQESIYKQKDIKTLTSSYAVTGKDSVVYSLQAEQYFSIQIKPRLAGSCDSIYTSVKIYVSNSDADEVYTAIADINDTYTASSDTLVTANATTGNNAWLYNGSSFQNVRIKVILLCLDNTNEDNYYDVYFVTKPELVWNINRNR